MKHSRYTVVYDACVLYPAPLRDLLLELASASLFRAKWSEQIHAEWIESVLRDRPDLARDKLNRTAHLMNEAVLDCLVDGHLGLIDSLALPDPNDRHVLAAAIHAGADAIVTFNLKDFPVDTCDQYQLEVLHPDDFIRFQFDFDNSAVIIAATRCRQRLQNPPKTAQEYLETLTHLRLPATVAALMPFASVL
ncbi:MAG: PIN domain-containing protein [Proteobacteria bacterium]|nr:PIN domain-containing protein [Pseudomonadota bacterium]